MKGQYLLEFWHSESESWLIFGRWDELEYALAEYHYANIGFKYVFHRIRFVPENNF